MTDQDTKPSEFWIENKSRKADVDLLLVYYNHTYNLQNPIHVIEYSAYEKLKKEFDELEMEQIEAINGEDI